MRVPAIAWWPGTIQAGRVSDEILAAIDLLPTFAAIAGAELPAQKIDGANIDGVLRGTPNSHSPHESIL